MIDPKYPDEVIQYAFDFRDYLIGAEVIRTDVAPVLELLARAADEDANDTMVASTPVLIAQRFVLTNLVGGVAGHAYTLRCKVVTDRGQTIYQELAVRVHARPGRRSKRVGT